jgi:outer membrane protein assembly factor BamB
MLHCLSARDGSLLWARTLEDPSPELTSSVTGHAASTPATGGRIVVAFFGNAGVVAHDAEGRQLWRRRLGEFESELGLASSPVIHGKRVFLACDHDGSRATSFDSFLIALELESGEVAWREDRPGVHRSWSTPLIVRGAEGEELVACAQEEVRGYDLLSGALLWRVKGLTEWVAPSPVSGGGLVFAAGGRDGAVLALRPGGRGEVAQSHTAWKKERESPNVCSPLLYEGRLYLLRENGILACYRASSGERLFIRRLGGRFTASPIAGAGNVYFTDEEGATSVLRAGDAFELLARNALEEYTIASAAAAGGRLFLRAERRLFAIGEMDMDDEKPERRGPEERAVEYLAREVPAWSRENGCFSCHNDGDGSRALFAARAAGLPVPGAAWAATAAWLARPERWSEQPGAAEYGDPALAGLQFAAALRAAIDSGVLREREPLATAVEAVARSQLADGSWRGGSEDAVGSPAAYSRHLATHTGLTLLEAAALPAHEEARRKAREWLRRSVPRNVHQAAVLLLARREAEDGAGEELLSAALAIIREGRSRDGGWGPYVNAAPEVFDSALVLLALARRREALARGGAEREKAEAAEIESWIRSGRGFLIAAQEEEGSWRETTRPAGGESYAQRISTTAWALEALMATR